MSATISWVIDYMQVRPTEGQYTDVVVTAGWRCNGLESVNDVDYTSTNYGSSSFPMPEGQFTPYNQLTQEQVLGWCWANGVDKTATEANVLALLEQKVNPPIIQPPLPWATPSA